MIQKSRPWLEVVGKRKAVLDGQAISYTVKRSLKVKRIRLEVRGETGLTVVIPKSYKLTQLPSLLKEKKRWILNKLVRYGHVSPLSTEKAIKSGDTIPYLGQDLKIVIRQNHGEADSVKLEQTRLLVNLKSVNSNLNLVLEGWYRQQAERFIRERAEELSARMGVTYGRLSIRGAKTRWGSCSHKANVNFNWKLMMAPKPVIDYIIIHELAHLKEMNHTEKFWQVVAGYCPGWRNHRRWLKDFQPELVVRPSA